MLFEDIIVHDSNRGLAIQARDGGEVYNIVFRRIFVNGTRLWYACPENLLMLLHLLCFLVFLYVCMTVICESACVFAHTCTSLHVAVLLRC